MGDGRNEKGGQEKGRESKKRLYHRENGIAVNNSIKG